MLATEGGGGRLPSKGQLPQPHGQPGGKNFIDWGRGLQEETAKAALMASDLVL